MTQPVATAHRTRRVCAPLLLLLGIAALVVGLLAATSAGGPHAFAGGSAAHPAETLVIAAGPAEPAAAGAAVVTASTFGSISAFSAFSAAGALDCDAVCILDGIVAALVGLGLALLGLFVALRAAARPLRVAARRRAETPGGIAVRGRPAARPTLSALSVLRV